MTSRRRFLGAAAALASLPTAAVEAAEASDDQGADADDTVDGRRSGVNAVVETVGGVEIYEDRNLGTEVEVAGYPNGVSLRLSNDLGGMNVLLLPEDVEPLCRQLIAARAETRAEDVADAREWITEDYRPGEDDE
jgi:hypothetical protein